VVRRRKWLLKDTYYLDITACRNGRGKIKKILVFQASDILCLLLPKVYFAKEINFQTNYEALSLLPFNYYLSSIFAVLIFTDGFS